MWYHFTPVRMALINKSTKKCWWDYGENGTLVHCWWECRLVQPLWKAVWGYLKELKMDLPFDPATPLLGTYPKKPKTVIWKNIRTPMFIWYPKYIKNSYESAPGKQTTQLKNGQMTWTDNSPRRTYRGSRDIWKDAQYH